MAVKELARVRGRFVEKVSKPILKQLLDDLLEEGLLNDGEKDSVLEDNSNKADMARALIDMVKRKGDKASRKMIEQRREILHFTLSWVCPVVSLPLQRLRRSKAGPPNSSPQLTLSGGRR